MAVVESVCGADGDTPWSRCDSSSPVAIDVCSSCGAGRVCVSCCPDSVSRVMAAVSVANDRCSTQARWYYWLWCVGCCRGRLQVEGMR